MKNFKYFIFTLFVCGCIQQGTERIRLVDANGEPVRINKVVPKFNEEQLKKQKEALNKSQRESGGRFTRNNPQNANRFQVNYVNDQNIIMPADQYPKDIFDDRITNYKYIDERKSQTTKNNSSSNNLRSNNTIRQNNNEKQIEINDLSKNNTGEPKMVNNTNKPKSLGTIQKNQKSTNLQNKNAINTASTTVASSTVIKSNTTVTKKAITTTQKTKTQSGKYFLQIGIYAKKENADKAYNKYTKIDKGVIREYKSKDQTTKYRVLIGPYTNKADAEKNLEKVIKTGHYDVYITEEK